VIRAIRDLEVSAMQSIIILQNRFLWNWFRMALGSWRSSAANSAQYKYGLFVVSTDLFLFGCNNSAK